MSEWIVTESLGGNDGFVPLEVTVGLMSRQEELIVRVCDFNGTLPGDLPPVLQRGIVRKGHFSKPQEPEKARLEH